MSSPYVNIHTHTSLAPTAATFSLPNVIISEDKLPVYPCSVGIHPGYMEQETSTAQLDTLYQYGQQEQVWAIGECGLDKVCETPWSLQENIFRQQIAYAQAIRKPLIIHCVRSYQECLQLLKEEQASVSVIFHGFQKNPTLAAQIVNRGYFISLGSAILSKKKDELILQVPLDKIFLETDDKSVSIVDIYTYFCRVRKIGLGLLKEQLYQNFKYIFNYPTGK